MKTKLIVLLAAIPVSFLPVFAEVPAPSQQKNIATALQPFVDRHELAGAVTLVANKDKILSLEAVGFADIAARMLMQVDALFWIASMSKPITAAALMMLVDEGKVKLDDPVEKYLPEFKGQLVRVQKGKEKPEFHKPQHPITVRELLTHTSGLPFSSSKEQPTLDKWTLAEGARSYAETPLLFEPGTNFQYSNAGINTAGRIIEVVSGMPYEDFLQKRLLGPLGMKDTTFWPNEEQLKRLAKSYRANETKDNLVETTASQLKYPLNDRKRQPMAAGGLFSTATDVGHFCQMVLNHGVYKGKRLLSEEAVKEMMRRQTGDKIKQSWGLGWSTSGSSFGHGGAFATDMSIDTKRGLVYVFMVQQSGRFPGDGNQCNGVFRRTAEKIFGNSGK